jgi:hypothetical protein
MGLRHALTLVTAVGALGAFACVGSATAPGVPSPAPGYLSDDYGTVFLASSPLMQGAKTVVKPLSGSPVNQVTAFPKPKPEPYVFVWAPSCTAAAQTVTFTRDVWLPGPPNLDGQFAYTSYRLGSFYSSLKTIDLIINGKVIVHQNFPSSGYNTVPLTETAAKAFKVGENSYEVRVHKAATTGACNAAKSDVVGVEFALSGHITTDLSVAQTDPTTYRRIGPNETTVQPFVVTMHNLGPSLIVTGTFHITVCCPDQLTLPGSESIVAAVIKEKTGLTPVSGCKLSPQSGQEFWIDCSIAGLAPGATASATALFQVHGPPIDVGDFSTSIGWNVVTTGITDPNYQNNQGGTKVVWCTSKPNDPGCSGATPTQTTQSQVKY